MTEKLNVAIVGAGQAGLSVSYFLKRAGVEHVLLEAGRVGETWRSRRWDSFCFVTPNWTIKLPGGEYNGAEPDGYLPLQEIVGHLEGWVASFDPPVRGGCEVLGLKPQGQAFELSLPEGGIVANTVVVATGAFQGTAKIETVHEEIPLPHIGLLLLMIAATMILSHPVEPCQDALDGVGVNSP